MLKAIAAAIVITTLFASVMLINGNIRKVSGFAELQCSSHQCFKLGDTVYMVK